MMLERLENLRVQDVIQTTLKKLEPEMAQQNREQMLRGQTSTDQAIRPEYAQSTRKRKGFSTPNLHETGAFQRAEYAEVKASTVDFGSKDPKNDKLMARYPNIHGLGTQAKTIVISKANVIAIDDVREKLDL